MNKECEVIQDLLPLYVDDICSDGSRALVEEHLCTCPACSAVLNKLKNCEIEEKLSGEKEEVISQQAKYFKRKSVVAGMIVAGILFIPILVCLIVNITSGSGMGWFFVVLTALMLTASLIVAPLLIPKQKAIWTVSLSTLFYCLMMLSIGNLIGNPPAFWGWTVLISVPALVYIWGIFSLLRFPECRFARRLGFCFIFTGLFEFFVSNIVKLCIGLPIIWPKFNPLCWEQTYIDGNVVWLLLIMNILVGIILVIAGKNRKNNRKDSLA